MRRPAICQSGVSGVWRSGVLQEYHDFFQYLERSKTELIRSADCAGRTFTFGDYVLECLYPLQNSTQRSVAYAQKLCDPNLTEEAMAWNLEAYKQTCNEDSSIWLLRKGSTDLALLSGDSTDEAMRAALCGRQARPRLQKAIPSWNLHPIFFRICSKNSQT